MSYLVTTPRGGRGRGPAAAHGGRTGGPTCPLCGVTRGERWEPLPILLSDLLRVHPGRPAEIPTAAGWGEELRARTAGVRLPRPGRSESSFRTDPSVCPVMLRHRYR